MASKRVATTSRGSAFYPRKRAVTACQVCRFRRTKCDRGEGDRTRCSYCASIDAECISEPAAQSAFDPASIAILERLGSLERKLDNIHSTPQQAETTERQTDLLPANLDAVLKWEIFQQSGSEVQSSSLHPSPRLDSTTAADAIPDPATYPKLADNFFVHVHVKNPILDEAVTRSLLQRLSLEGFGYDARSCLALLIYANGALARPLESPPLTAHDLAFQEAQYLFRAAQKRMGPVMDSADVFSAQCLLFFGVFNMACLRPLDAWRYFVQGLAVCQSFPALNPLARQRSRQANPAAESVYWSCWKSEHELRIELGLSDEAHRSTSYPQLFPTLPDDLEGESLRAWYFYLSEISLWRLEVDAQSVMKKCVEKAGPAYDTLASIASANLEHLSLWQSRLPSAVNIEDTDRDILNFVLRGRTTFIRELLTWPFVHAAIHGRAVSLEWLAKGLEAHLECLKVNRAGYYHRHHGTWLTIRSSARSACILVAYACACAESRLETPLQDDSWVESVRATVDMLQFWGGEVDGFLEIADLLDKMLARATQST